MTEDIKAIRARVERLKGERKRIADEVDEVRKQLIKETKKYRTILEAKEVLIQVSKIVQSEVSLHFSELVTLAMMCVFAEDGYKMEVDFVEKRGKTECELMFGKGDLKLDPFSSSGGGMIDVAAFALRLAFSSLSRSNHRPVFILDEPFKFLSVSYMPSAAKMLRLLREELGVQIIYVTHSDILAKEADVVHKLRRRKEEDYVEAKRGMDRYVAAVDGGDAVADSDGSSTVRFRRRSEGKGRNHRHKKQPQ